VSLLLHWQHETCTMNKHLFFFSAPQRIAAVNRYQSLDLRLKWWHLRDCIWSQWWTEPVMTITWKCIFY
jgi:hypothetical protein